MEDHSYLEKTLHLYHQLRDSGLPVAVTWQTYLHCTANDLERITQQPAAIRLVKGALAESSQIAWTRKDDIDASFMRLSEKLLQSEMRERVSIRFLQPTTIV